MVTHVVLFKMKDRSGESAVKVKDLLLSLRDGNIPGLQSVEAGIDYSREGRSFDVALITKHDDRAALDAYQVHPFHKEVARQIGELREQGVAVDFED
jgi:hypothetical protein